MTSLPGYVHFALSVCYKDSYKMPLLQVPGLSTCVALAFLSVSALRTRELQPDSSGANLEGDWLSHEGCFPRPSITPSRQQTRMCYAWYVHSVSKQRS